MRIILIFQPQLEVASLIDATVVLPRRASLRLLCDGGNLEMGPAFALKDHPPSALVQYGDLPLRPFRR